MNAHIKIFNQVNASLLHYFCASANDMVTGAVISIEYTFYTLCEECYSVCS